MSLACQTWLVLYHIALQAIQASALAAWALISCLWSVPVEGRDSWLLELQWMPLGMLP